MKCHESKIVICLYLDGETGEKQQARLFNHLKECPSCHQEMSKAQALHELLAKNCTLEEVPPAFRDSVMTKIDINRQANIEKVNSLAGVIRKRKFWETKFGIGLLAGAAGLFLTYYIAESIPNINLASQEPLSKAGVIQKNASPKTNILLAEVEKADQQPVKPQPTKNIEIPSKKNTETQKPKITPVRIPSGVAKRIAQIEPEQGVVDLPKPLSISSYIYSQGQENVPPAIGEDAGQPLNTKLSKLKESTISARLFNRSLQIITQSAQVAKLWQLESTKVREIGSKEVAGFVVNTGSKLVNIVAEKAAVSSAGTLATITKPEVGTTLQLSLGGKSTFLDGNVISNLTWSPEGKKVVYFIENGKRGHLESYDGENRFRLTTDMSVQAISWTFVNENKLILNIQADTPGIWELQIPDGKMTPLAGVGGGKYVASNSKNDIAFTDASGKIYALIHDASGEKKLVQLTTQVKAVAFLTWTTDKNLLYLVSGQEQTEIWKIILP